MKQFDSSPEWVQTMVANLEPTFGLMREQSEILSKVRRLLYRYDQLTTEAYNRVLDDSAEGQRLAPVDKHTILDENQKKEENNG